MRPEYGLIELFREGDYLQLTTQTLQTAGNDPHGAGMNPARRVR